MGDIREVLRGLAIGWLVLATSIAFGGLAEAKLAGAGKTFPVSWLPMEKGAIPGGHSGIGGMGLVTSPITDNGRFVLFTSTSTNLVPDANPNNINLYRKDMQTGNVVLVNRLDGKTGASSPGYFYGYDMSNDGNLVVIVAQRRLTAEDTDDETDVYLRDIAAGTTTLISEGTVFPVGEADISADGAYVVFTTQSPLVPGDVNIAPDIYRYRIADGSIEIVSRIPALPNAGNNASTESAISGDGRWVAFRSRATNLIPGFVDNNGGFSGDVFLRDMTDGVTYLVSSRFNSSTQGNNGDTNEPRIAGTPGDLASVRVAFTGYGTDLADNGVTDPSANASIYFKQMPEQASELISRASGPAGENADSRAHTPTISNDGSRIVFSSDATNLGAGANFYGVYVRDRAGNTTRLVSARNDYAIWGVVAGNGVTATWSETGGATPDSDPDLGGVFRRNLDSNQIRFVSRPKGKAKVQAPGFTASVQNQMNQRLSANGRYWAFETQSNDLAPGEPPVSQAYRRDLATGRIELISRGTGNDGAIAESGYDPSISADGNFVVFVAHGQLDPADTNDRQDVYVRNVAAGTTTLISRANGADGAVSNEGGANPSISTDGNVIVFNSEATNMGNPGPHTAVYVRDVVAGETTIASRATGVAGALANATTNRGQISADGNSVIFISSATNLSPDDPLNNASLYLRDRSTSQTRLVSRAPGLAGASIIGSISDPVISPDASRVAFATNDSAAVPDTAPWPAGDNQIVVRTLADGTNQLASSSAGGVVGDDRSIDPALNGDGSVVAFGTEATNLRTDVDLTGNPSVAVKNLADGSVSGPPLFGDPDGAFFGSRNPSISANGNCVVFEANGTNAISGNLGPTEANYLYVRAGTCQDPKALKPKLSAVSIKPAKFRVGPKRTARASKRKKARRGTKIRFRLNTRATVTIRIDRKTRGRKADRKCVRPTVKNKRRKACKRLVFRGKLVRRNLAAGKRTVPFSGRIGRKALKPGRYRAVLRANGPGGASKKVYRSFRIVRR